MPPAKLVRCDSAAGCWWSVVPSVGMSVLDIPIVCNILMVCTSRWCAEGAEPDHRRRIVGVPPSQSRSRRAHHAASTRAALVDSAVELFTENGYGETSLDAIVSRARVTKGEIGRA